MAESIRALGFPVGRLRTGTPPRLKLDSIDFGNLEAQTSDDPVQPFSFEHEYAGFRPINNLIDCFMTYTN